MKESSVSLKISVVSVVADDSAGREEDENQDVLAVRDAVLVSISDENVGKGVVYLVVRTWAMHRWAYDLGCCCGRDVRQRQIFSYAELTADISSRSACLTSPFG
jgi:hypothetical protein